MVVGVNDILYLFDRPGEPLCLPKGEDEVVFDVPTDYMPEEARERPQSIAGAIPSVLMVGGLVKININRIPIPPIDTTVKLGRHDAFSLFIPAHRKLAMNLVSAFLDAPTIEDLKSLGTFYRDRVNSLLFNYALSTAILHRSDTKHLPIPSLPEVFPSEYFDGRTVTRAKEEAYLASMESRVPVEIKCDLTASNLDEEHRLAYFREDVGVNLHHWHWHLVYPKDGPAKIVKKDRRGELFYYMHQQIMARYNIERFCNHLKRVAKLNNFREPIPEAYFPKLDLKFASRTWPSRPAGSTLKDINRLDQRERFDIDDLERYRDRIYEIIHTGFYVDTRGAQVKLDEFSGIDVLGNIVEASTLSPNPKYYGDLHNQGHTAISFCHDPDNRYAESFGVMGDPATAMRDPVFFRWHGFINHLFLEYKNTLSPYGTDKLEFAGVEITKVQLVTPNEDPDSVVTLWSQSNIDLSRGLDFAPRGPVYVKITHLNHLEFTYNIDVTNHTARSKRGTCRVFVGPKYDERGELWTFVEQKDLMIELDKFTVDLKPGRDTITRKSTDSAVTIPFERTFRKLDKSGCEEYEFNMCGCGWPHHMLVPKGTTEGFPVELFVMISDYRDDKVTQDDRKCCSDAASYCGLRDKKYPDARPMGYPFDRLPRDGVNTLGQFLTSNMAITDVTIKFRNATK